MTPEQIAALPTETERAAAINEYGARVFDDTKRMVDGYIGRFSDFVLAYKQVRRAQRAYFKAAKAKQDANEIQQLLVKSKELESALDKKAAGLFA